MPEIAGLSDLRFFGALMTNLDEVVPSARGMQAVIFSYPVIGAIHPDSSLCKRDERHFW